MKSAVRQRFTGALLLACCAATALAGPISYHVNMDFATGASGHAGGTLPGTGTSSFSDMLPAFNGVYSDVHLEASGAANWTDATPGPYSQNLVSYHSDATAHLVGTFNDTTISIASTVATNAWYSMWGPTNAVADSYASTVADLTFRLDVPSSLAITYGRTFMVDGGTTSGRLTLGNGTTVLDIFALPPSPTPVIRNLPAGDYMLILTAELQSGPDVFGSQRQATYSVNLAATPQGVPDGGASSGLLLLFGVTALIAARQRIAALQ